MQQEMTDMIEQARDYAREELGAKTESMERGLALHDKLFTCDLFGFLPATRSRAGHELFTEMIKDGATRCELVLVEEVLYKSSPVHDSECKEMFLDAIAQTKLNCTVLTVGSEKSLHHSLNRISASIHLLDNLDAHLKKALSVEHVAEAGKQGKMAVFLSANGAPAQSGLEDGMDAHGWIDVMYRLGIRFMHLTYNRRNWVGDGCLEPANGGLSLHGREVVKHLNRIGIVVDTAHSGRQTTLDAVKYSRLPIMATHTTCGALYDHPRAKSDEELKAIADNGGLVGICSLSSFLKEKGGGIRDLLDHIDYAVNLIGADHVAIGTDSTFVPPLPADLEFVHATPTSPYSNHEWYGAWDYAQKRRAPDKRQRMSLDWINWPYFTVGLVDRGYSEADIAKILGGNFLRVFGAVQQGKECEAIALHKVMPRLSNRAF